MAEQQADRSTDTGWSGQWCWTRKHLPRPWNYYAFFRKIVELPVRPQRALVRVSAQARYTLYVNGKRVHYGPARSYPQSQSYDILDLSDYLQVGKNVICAIVLEFGVPTFQSVFRGLSGFLLDGVIEADGQLIPLHTPEGWLCREAKGWRKDVARLSVQLGFQEHYDADADPPAWMEADYKAAEEDGWHVPWIAGPVGTHPWLHMEGRGVPLLADHVENFTEVAAQFSGENARGYKIADDVYRLALQEKHTRARSLLENPQAMLKDDAAVTIVAPPTDGEFVTAVLDLGTCRAGHFILDIADAAGDEIIDILYTEAVDEKSKFSVLLTSGSEEAMADRYRCRPGKQRWEAFQFKGLRYATLVFRNVEKPLQVRYVGLRQVHAALEELGSFECSDARLNQIWLAARNTQRNCAFDAFVDCPGRGQAQWWGDARVQARVTAYAYGDSSLLERGIRQVAQSQASDGSLLAHPPADAPKHHLPDFMLTWVGTLWDYYFHSGREPLLHECLPVMHRLFEFFAAHEVKDGLIGDFDGWWVFLDGRPLFKNNLSGVLNLMYLQAIRWAAAISQICGDDAAATRYTAKATQMVETLETYFWDASAKVWRDGYDAAKGAPVDSVSQHMNALAILLDLKPESHLAIARDVLLKAARAKRGKIIEASPFFYAYVLEAMAEAGLKSEVVEIIGDKWGQMLDAGATTFWEDWTGTGSRCHAWSASPLYHLSQQVLGVVPVDVGWKSVRIAPLPAGLDFARGVIPSPLGNIRVEWEKAEEDQLAVRVDLPPGIEAEFVGPLGEIRALTPGSHEFHT